MGGSADPEAPTPTPSPSPSPAKATPSPASADGNRLRRCVQSKLSWGPPKAGGGGGEAGGAGLPPLAAGDGTPEKVKKRGRPRKSEAGKKPSSNRETTGLEQDSKDEVILVDESPQKKQRKGRGKNQGAALKVPNRKHCKALESTDGEHLAVTTHTFLCSRTHACVNIVGDLILLSFSVEVPYHVGLYN
jgi:hypothetical protein